MFLVSTQLFSRHLEKYLGKEILKAGATSLLLLKMPWVWSCPQFLAIMLFRQLWFRCFANLLEAILGSSRSFCPRFYLSLFQRRHRSAAVGADWCPRK